MEHFYIWETVTFPLEISPEGLLDDVLSAIVSIRQDSTFIEKTGAELGIDAENNTVIFHLSQEETSRFAVGVATLQLNLLYTDHERDTSAQVQIRVLDNLHKELMNG